jgi:ATP-dependent DNA helicase PIF1
MSRSKSRTNIKILALPLDADAQEEEAKWIRKMLKRIPREKTKNASNKEGTDMKTPIVDRSFTKNIVFNKVLTL